MTKVFKEPKSYIERVLIRSISRMNPSNYTEEVKPRPPGPAPVKLTPWVVDRSYEIGSGDKFLFDTSTDPLEFLKSLETAGEGGASLYSNGMYRLVSSGSPHYAAIVFAMVNSGKYFLLGNTGAGIYGYASDDFSQDGMSLKKGWNCPENGIVEVTSNVGHVGELSPITGWNGVFTGFEKKQS